MKKVYAVKQGKKTGIFDSWDEVKEYVSGYPGAEYKGFKTKKEAEEYLLGNIKKDEDVSSDTLIAYVDGSYMSDIGKYSFGTVMIYDNKVLATLNGVGQSEEAAKMRNVAGELLGAMNATKYAIDNGYDKLTIYHDYEGIGKWAEGKWKTNLNCTKMYKAYMDSKKDKVTVSFVKVAAHTGVKYNELADKLAKDAFKKI